RIGAPVPWDPANGVYYVEISWAGVSVVNKRDYQFGLVEAQDANFSTHWDPTNDPSYAGLKTGQFVSTPDPNIPVYLNGVKVFGNEPPIGGPTPTPSPSGSPSPRPSPSPSASPSPSPSPSGPGGVKARYQVGQTATSTNEIRNVIHLVN